MNLVKPAAVLSLLFSVAGCKIEDQRQAQLLVGTWDCRVSISSDDDGLDGTATVKVQYLKNRKSNMDAEVSFEANGIQAGLHLVGYGKWEIEDGNLVEEIEKMNITGVEIFGQSLLPSELPIEAREVFDGIVDAYQGMSSMSEIRRLTDSELETYSPIENETVRCKAL